jgi:hypothetical protein
MKAPITVAMTCRPALASIPESAGAFARRDTMQIRKGSRAINGGSRNRTHSGVKPRNSGLSALAAMALALAATLHGPTPALAQEKELQVNVSCFDPVTWETVVEPSDAEEPTIRLTIHHCGLCNDTAELAKAYLRQIAGKVFFLVQDGKKSVDEIKAAISKEIPFSEKFTIRPGGKFESTYYCFTGEQIEAYIDSVIKAASTKEPALGAPNSNVTQ